MWGNINHGCNFHLLAVRKAPSFYDKQWSSSSEQTKYNSKSTLHFIYQVLQSFWVSETRWLFSECIILLWPVISNTCKWTIRVPKQHQSNVVFAPSQQNAAEYRRIRDKDVIFFNCKLNYSVCMRSTLNRSVVYGCRHQQSTSDSLISWIYKRCKGSSS